MIDLDAVYGVSNQLTGLPHLGHDAVAHAKLRAPVFLDEHAWRVVDLFRPPTSLRHALAALGAEGENRVLVERAVLHFVETGILVGPDENQYLYDRWVDLALPRRPAFSPASPSFLGATPDALAAVDFHFAGVAFDRAARCPGAAGGPGGIRSASVELPAHHDPRTHAFRGLWDHAQRRLLLDGARLRDHGDVCIDGASGLAESYAAMHSAAESLTGEASGTLVFFGGDHSITEPIVRAVAKAKGPLFLLHFDAHTDMSPAYRTRPHHHGSVMDLLRRSDLVDGILQVGVRDFGPPWWRGAEKTTVLSADHVRGMAPSDIVGAIPEGATLYISIDIDVLDPSESPGTGVPIPGGLRVAELGAILAAVGAARAVAGIDLVEVAPCLDRSGMTSRAAVQILLRLLDSVHRRRLNDA